PCRGCVRIAPISIFYLTGRFPLRYHTSLKTAPRVVFFQPHKRKIELMTPKEVLEFAKKHECKQMDLRFTDLPGLQQHVSYPISELDEDSFEEGFGIDGSSI